MQVYIHVFPENISDEEIEALLPEAPGIINSAALHRLPSVYVGEMPWIRAYLTRSPTVLTEHPVGKIVQMFLESCPVITMDMIREVEKIVQEDWDDPLYSLTHKETLLYFLNFYHGRRARALGR